jgi:hypothetical protein
MQINQESTINDLNSKIVQIDYWKSSNAWILFIFNHAELSKLTIYLFLSPCFLLLLQKYKQWGLAIKRLPKSAAYHSA